MNLADKEYLSSLEKEVIGNYVYFFSPSDKEYLSNFKDTIETLEELNKSKNWYQRIFDSKKLSEAKRIYKEEIDVIVKRISDLHKEQREEERLFRSKESKMSRYRQLRREIESMPQYGIWRQAVLQKFGRKCAVCGSIKNLEVDHRYKSFYEITRKNGITNKIQAYGCAELWDVDNGAPLCKTHHDQTPSSRKYLQNNQTII
jgi:predicted restriction endonuclease